MVTPHPLAVVHLCGCVDNFWGTLTDTEQTVSYQNTNIDWYKELRYGVSLDRTRA